MAIQSFGDRDIQLFFETGIPPKRSPWRNIQKVVMRKLDMTHYAAQLQDLHSPPGNRLEALKGNLKGFHSIRINDQWRIIFRWSAKGPEQVSVTDYH